MADYHWQALNLLQMWDVLRNAGYCRLAVEEDGQPWCIPMGFQFEVSGTDTIIHLVTEDKGRKMEALKQNDRLCLEFELPGCAWLDTVVIIGRAGVGTHVPGEAVHLRVRAREMSGRRYFLPAE